MQLYLRTRNDVTSPLVPNLLNTIFKYMHRLRPRHIFADCIQRKALGPTLLPSVANRAAAAAAGARKSPARVHTGRRLAGIVQGPNNGLLSAVDSACVCIATNSSSVVCSCAVGFVSDGQSGCKSESMQCPVSYVSLII